MKCAPPRIIALTICLALGVVLVTALPRKADLRPTPAVAAAKTTEEKSRPTPRFVGVRLCRACHKDPKTGDQYAQWKGTKHAEAYRTLGTKKSAEVAARLGIADPGKDMRCLRCHVTGVEKPELSKKLKVTDGVQCESCHGPGQFYSKKDVFGKGRQVAIEHGLVVPDRKLCVRCHNEESPTFPGEFDFEEAWKKVLHPNPEKKEKGG